MKALVLAPHPDDEINIAGSTIINLIRAGVEVFVAYSTNGDFNVPADIRAAEAVKALSILGVERDHIIWLGYGITAPASRMSFTQTRRRNLPQGTLRLMRPMVLNRGVIRVTRGKIFFPISNR